jgi:hypothetical protein
MSAVKNLALGVGGSLLAVTMQDMSHAAAIVAGLSTGVWMLTQTFMALRRRK